MLKQIYTHHDSRAGDWRPLARTWPLFSNHLDRSGSEYPFTGHAYESQRDGESKKREGWRSKPMVA